MRLSPKKLNLCPMKYTTQIEINATPELIASLLTDHKQLKHWVKGLKNYRILSGDSRHTGAKTSLEIQIGTLDIELIETVERVEFPQWFTTRYEIKEGIVQINISLETLEPGRTRYKVLHDFQFTGMLRFSTSIMKPAYILHSHTMMKDFKELAEKTALISPD
jgi:carbon monoxide dehydrogenase subunit G